MPLWSGARKKVGLTSRSEDAGRLKMVLKSGIELQYADVKWADPEVWPHWPLLMKKAAGTRLPSKTAKNVRYLLH